MPNFRILARPITRQEVNSMIQFLTVQPMTDDRYYLYRDEFITAKGGWWVCHVVGTDGTVTKFQDGSLLSMLDQLDKYLNDKLTRSAINSVLRTLNLPLMPQRS